MDYIVRQMLMLTALLACCLGGYLTPLKGYPAIHFPSKCLSNSEIVGLAKTGGLLARQQ